MRSLSSPLPGLGGFRRIHASPPRKGATPASPGPSSPILRGVTLKVFPRLSTPPDFSLPCSNSPLFPAGNGAPSSYSSARQSGLWSPLVPESDTKDPFLFSAAPPPARRETVGGGGVEPREEEKGNQLDWISSCHGNWSCSIVMVTNVRQPVDPPLAKRYPGRCPGFPLGFPYI